MGTEVFKVDQTSGAIDVLEPKRNWMQKAVDRIRGGPSVSLAEIATVLTEAAHAREQGTMVAEFVEANQTSGMLWDVQQPAGSPWAVLRLVAAKVTPVKAIVNRRVSQALSYADTPHFRQGRSRAPGFVIEMSNPEEPCTDADRAQIRMLEMMMRETGFCPPPESETPTTYQPGLDGFIAQVMPDRLILDQIAFRTWPSKRDPDRYPVVSFAAVDAGLIYRATVRKAPVQNGVAKPIPFNSVRENLRGRDVRYVKFGAQTGRPEQQFTSDELTVAAQNVRTDELNHGYGWSETEQLLDEAMTWMYSLQYNSSRFRKDSLPRGLLSLVGKISEPQLKAFKLQWKQLLQGNDNRWNIPILRADPQQGTSVVWTPMDMSSRDMEYHQFMFMLAVFAHSIFGIHPEETGWEALSAIRPPLSQGSPEAKLNYSQDWGLRPLLRWLESVINRRIIWRLHPDRKFRFRFVGLGDYDEGAEIALITERLNAGLMTPRMAWAYLDQQIPEDVKDHPAWDFPAPIMQGIQMAQSMSNSQMQQDQSQQKQAFDMDRQDRNDWQAQGNEDPNLPSSGQGGIADEDEDDSPAPGGLPNGAYKQLGRKASPEDLARLRKAIASNDVEDLRANVWRGWRF
jgi:hypothetical protein